MLHPLTNDRPKKAPHTQKEEKSHMPCELCEQNLCRPESLPFLSPWPPWLPAASLSTPGGRWQLPGARGGKQRHRCEVGSPITESRGDRYSAAPLEGPFRSWQPAGHLGVEARSNLRAWLGLKTGSPFIKLRKGHPFARNGSPEFSAARVWETSFLESMACGPSFWKRPILSYRVSQVANCVTQTFGAWHMYSKHPFPHKQAAASGFRRFGLVTCQAEKLHGPD